MNTNAELLKELRIDRKAAPPPSRRGLWIALAVVAVLLIVAGAAWAILGRDRGIEVQTATVQAIGGSSGSASVLDATGYVVARRMATVSAQSSAERRGGEECVGTVRSRWSSDHLTKNKHLMST